MNKILSIYYRATDSRGTDMVFCPWHNVVVIEERRQVAF